MSETKPKFCEVTRASAGRDWCATPVDGGWVIATIDRVVDGPDPHLIVGWGDVQRRNPEGCGHLLPRGLFRPSVRPLIGRWFPTLDELRSAVLPHVLPQVTVRVDPVGTVHW